MSDVTSDQGAALPPVPAVPPPSSAPPPASDDIFRGPNGIRAGWRVLIFFLVLAGIVLVCVTGLVLVARLRGQTNTASAGFGSGMTPFGLGLTEGSLFLFTGLSALIMARIERRNWGQYGLPAKFAFRQDFWIGLVVGFAAISAGLLGIFALGGFHLTGVATHGAALLKATAAWSATFVLVGLAEEFSFRGYLQFTLGDGIGFWPAAVLLSALFALAHASNPGESKFGLLSVVLFGLLFCLFLRRTGNLWWAVGFHAGWDWGQTFFYGVSDSGIPPYHNFFNSTFHGPAWLTGGSVGPEASIFTPIVLGIVAIFFSRSYRAPGVGPRPSA